MNLNDYKDNVYSQYGEDGIIKYLLECITRTNFVVEFGAADGFFCSNTANIWVKDKNVSALLIESDFDLYLQLEQNTAKFGNTKIKNGFVWNIDDWTTEIADVCSIDVDGADYQIARDMQVPHQIVLVEYNPTVPPDVEMIHMDGTMYGSSALSIANVMSGKGYTLVACTKTNLIFLYGNHGDRFESRLDVLFDRSSLNYVVTSYDGYYDMIGEFGYGFRSPVDLRLSGRTGYIRKTVDTDTQEWVRRVNALEKGKNV